MVESSGGGEMIIFIPMHDCPYLLSQGAGLGSGTTRRTQTGQDSFEARIYTRSFPSANDH